MSMTIGKILKMAVSGASHEKEIAVRVSGFPAGATIDMQELKSFLARRKAINNFGATLRNEDDEPEIIGGIKDGLTDGADIIVRVLNKNVDGSEYAKYDDMPRPSHADFVSHEKYGHSKPGGGMFSGRMTLAYCIAGGMAVQYLKQNGIKIGSFISRIGNAQRKGYDFVNPEKFDFVTTDLTEEMKYEISAAAGRLDSVGGEIECYATGLPVGVGEPLFDGIEAKTAQFLYSIPAVKGVEFGKGFGFSEMCGSNANDSFIWQNGVVKTVSNNNGGVNGGLSNGMPVVVKVAVKPTPSIGIVQNTVSLSAGENVALEIKGRHDTCIVPRAAVVVEALLAFSLLDLMLEGKFIKPLNTVPALRAEIDDIDDAISQLLIRRFDAVKRIGKVKKKQGVPSTDTMREKEIIAKVSAKTGIGEADVTKIYGEIFTLSKKIQK